MARYEYQTSKSGHRRYVRVDDARQPAITVRPTVRPVPLIAADLHPDRSDHTKAQLATEADSRGLDTSGNKPDILARLEASDG